MIRNVEHGKTHAQFVILEPGNDRQPEVLGQAQIQGGEGRKPKTVGAPASFTTSPFKSCVSGKAGAEENTAKIAMRGYRDAGRNQPYFRAVINELDA
jgi:hypothetical protein